MIYAAAKMYNEAYILIEMNDLGEQVAYTIHSDYEYENILQTENGGRNGKKLSSGFGQTSGRGLGVVTTKSVKNPGCSIVKMLIEQNQLIINDIHTINELSTFSKKGTTYEAEPGKHDDLVMGLVLFGWMSAQPYFKELTEISTIAKLREKTEDEVHEDLTPFGFHDDHQDDLDNPDPQKERGWFMPVEYDDL